MWSLNSDSECLHDVSPWHQKVVVVVIHLQMSLVIDRTVFLPNHIRNIGYCGGETNVFAVWYTAKEPTVERVHLREVHWYQCISQHSPIYTIQCWFSSILQLPLPNYSVFISLETLCGNNFSMSKMLIIRFTPIVSVYLLHFGKHCRHIYINRQILLI